MRVWALTASSAAAGLTFFHLGIFSCSPGHPSWGGTTPAAGQLRGDLGSSSKEKQLGVLGAKLPRRQQCDLLANKVNNGQHEEECGQKQFEGGSPLHLICQS